MDVTVFIIDAKGFMGDFRSSFERLSFIIMARVVVSIDKVCPSEHAPCIGIFRI